MIRRPPRSTLFPYTTLFRSQIICLHELFRGEYFCRIEDAELFNLAEPIPGPTTEKLALVAKEKNVALVVSIFERRAPGVYHNSCAVLDADGSFRSEEHTSELQSRLHLV